MSSDTYSPDAWRDNNGQHTWQSLNNYGQHAAQNGWQPVPQQHNETSTEYAIRQNSFNWNSNGTGS